MVLCNDQDVKIILRLHFQEVNYWLTLFLQLVFFCTLGIPKL